MELIELLPLFVGATEKEIDNLPITQSALTKSNQRRSLESNMEMIMYSLNGTVSFFEIFIDHDDESRSTAIKLNRFNIESVYRELSEHKIMGMKCNYSDGFFISDDRFNHLLVEKVTSPGIPPSVMISIA